MLHCNTSSWWMKFPFWHSALTTERLWKVILCTTINDNDMCVCKTWNHLEVTCNRKIYSTVYCSILSTGMLTDFIPVEYNEPTSLMVSVWDIIWILTCDWLVGRLSVERDLTSCRELLSSVRLFSNIFVLMKTLEIYAELNPLIPNAVRRTFADVTLK